MTVHRQYYAAWTDLDLRARGKSVGSIYLSQSTSASAYRAPRVPLIVIRNGEGPGCLVTGGVHGDEWEGQIVAAALARDIEASDLRGTLIIMPHANFPACKTGSRLSPLDDGNLNMIWPGEEGGGPTAQIARFVEREILPLVTHWVDMHSGGRTLIYSPKPAIHIAEDKALNQKAFEALAVFGAPENLVFEVQETRSASVAAQRAGVVYVYGEFGGGSLVSQEGIELARTGSLRLLKHLGILPRVSVEAPTSPQRHLAMTGKDFAATRALYWFAEGDGFFEPRVSFGDRVETGQVIGLVHALDGGLGIEPVTAKAEGALVCLRGQPLVEYGDCLGHLGVDIALQDMLDRWT